MELESTEAGLVLADELEDCGDPRAELVRAQVHGLEHSALIREHWSQWVGALEPRSALLRWKWGHLVEVGVKAAPAGWTPVDLITKPTAGLLSRLALGPKVPSRGLEHARALRHLVCFGALESKALPTVETLSIDLDSAGAQLLPSLVAPKLTGLHTRATAQDEGQLFRSLGRAPWFGGLQTWTHRLAAPESLAALLANGPLVERGGAGLQLLCEEPALQAITDAVRRSLPRTQWSLLRTPERPHDPEDSHGPMVTHVVPSCAAMDFRALAPREHSSKPGVQSSEPVLTTTGSGFPLETYLFSTCSWCGSSKTLGIWWRSSSLYSHHETTSYDSWEYECHDCGLFTEMRKAQTF